MDIKDLFIVFSTLLILAAPTPYIRNVIKRATKPKVVSWFNWTWLTIISASASLSDRQYAAAIISYSLALMCVTIAMLGWRNGDKRFDRLDIFCQMGIVIALVLWWTFNSPAIAIISVIVIDFIALVPTLKHSWEKPHEETGQLFIMTGIGALFATLAARTVSITALANPIYIAIADLITAAVIIGRRKVLKK